jgi:hypothetical protein
MDTKTTQDVVRWHFDAWTRGDVTKPRSYLADDLD